MKKMYDLNAIASQLGLPSREAPGPRGMSLEYLWDVPAADRFLALIEQDGADFITLDGHPQAWLACYLALKLAPKTLGLFIPPMGGDVPMKKLPLGAANPDGHVDMNTEPFQDGLLLHFSPDTRDYHAEYLDAVTLPEALKGQHVYLQGMAPNFITGSLALTLAEVCPSVSVGGQDGSFLCVFSAQPEKAPGQVTGKKAMEMPGGPGPMGGGKPPMPPRKPPYRKKGDPYGNYPESDHGPVRQWRWCACPAR